MCQKIVYIIFYQPWVLPSHHTKCKTMQIPSIMSKLIRGGTYEAHLGKDQGDTSIIPHLQMRDNAERDEKCQQQKIRGKMKKKKDIKRWFYSGR